MTFRWIIFRALVLILPIWLLDSCANRDPNFQIDEQHRLSAVSVYSPLQLSSSGFDQESRRITWRWTIDNVKYFKLSDRVMTGLTDTQYFIVDRPTDEPFFYATPQDRDRALILQFGSDISTLKPLPWYTGLRSNLFYPYNLIYYGLVIAGTTVTGLLRARLQRQIEDG